MNGKFFSDLALQNIRRNRQSYLPYALSCTGMVAIFFIMGVLAGTQSLHNAYGGRTIQGALNFGVWVMILFAIVFLFYTHSFLIKRRRKEFGLFNILGMEKKHIGWVLAIETILVGVASTGVGMLLGALFSRLMYLLMLKLLGIEQIGSLDIPSGFIPATIMVFGAIHLLTLLNTLRQVHLARPVELLRGESLGEKAPRARMLLAMVGAACLLGGYGISLRAQSALKALPQFFIAVVLVIVATYALFIAGSISVLRMMQRNQRFYYQPKHFSVVAGMRHRMNRNAAGLASICILSTMVLVMVAATASVFAGREDVLRERYPREAMMTLYPLRTDEQAAKIEAIFAQEVQRAGASVQDMARYPSVSFRASLDNGAIRFHEDEDGWDGLSPRMTVELVSADDYAAATQQEVSLASGEALAFTTKQRLPETVTIGGHTIRILRYLDAVAPLNNRANMVMEYQLLVLSPADKDAIVQAINQQRPEAIRLANPLYPSINFAFNTGLLAPEAAQEMMRGIRERSSQLMRENNDGGYSIISNHIAVDRTDFNALYGGMLFVTVFLGLVFIMAMVLLIYYKQVSEGYEDKGRFLIMQQVGMSKEEVKASIKSQVLMVFFLPLLMAGLHLLAAFNITSKVLNLMMLTNTKLLAMVTLAAYLGFALFYIAVYWKTAHSYYKIVKA